MCKTVSREREFQRESYTIYDARLSCFQSVISKLKTITWATEWKILRYGIGLIHLLHGNCLGLFEKYTVIAACLCPIFAHILLQCVLN